MSDILPDQEHKESPCEWYSKKTPTCRVTGNTVKVDCCDRCSYFKFVKLLEAQKGNRQNETPTNT